jgi:formate dehydrogenase subunit gamma
MNQADPWDAERARQLIEELRGTPGALLQILHALQDEFGYIDNASVPIIARALNITRAQVYSTISFYPDFRNIPPGRHVLRMCRAEACQSMGSDNLIRHVENRLATQLGQTTADGTFTVEQIFCLGFCSQPPAVMLDGMPYGHVTPQVLDSLLERSAKANLRASVPRDSAPGHFG